MNRPVQELSNSKHSQPFSSHATAPFENRRFLYGATHTCKRTLAAHCPFHRYAMRYQFGTSIEWSYLDPAWKATSSVYVHCMKYRFPCSPCITLRGFVHSTLQFLDRDNSLLDVVISLRPVLQLHKIRIVSTICSPAQKVHIERIS